jgi:hypothetical protein
MAPIVPLTTCPCAVAAVLSAAIAVDACNDCVAVVLTDALADVDAAAVVDCAWLAVTVALTPSAAVTATACP